MSDEEEIEQINSDLENDVHEDEINDPSEDNDNSEFVESDDDEQDVFDKPVITQVKKKRELTAEHKEKLRQGRLKALENRRNNARQKKEMKELAKKKKEMEHKVLKQEVENYDNPAMNGFSEDFKQTWNLTEEQIIDLQEKAVEKYDTKRKKRKEEKKKTQATKNHNDSLKQVVKNTTSTIDNAWTQYYIPQ